MQREREHSGQLARLAAVSLSKPSIGRRRRCRSWTRRETRPGIVRQSLGPHTVWLVTRAVCVFACQISSGNELSREPAASLCIGSTRALHPNGTTHLNASSLLSDGGLAYRRQAKLQHLGICHSIASPCQPVARALYPTPCLEPLVPKCSSRRAIAQLSDCHVPLAHWLAPVTGPLIELLHAPVPAIGDMTSLLHSCQDSIRQTPGTSSWLPSN